jgi:hypothetical protein
MFYRDRFRDDDEGMSPRPGTGFVNAASADSVSAVRLERTRASWHGDLDMEVDAPVARVTDKERSKG